MIARVNGKLNLLCVFPMKELFEKYDIAWLDRKEGGRDYSRKMLFHLLKEFIGLSKGYLER